MVKKNQEESSMAIGSNSEPNSKLEGEESQGGISESSTKRKLDKDGKKMLSKKFKQMEK